MNLEIGDPCPACPHTMGEHDDDGCVICDAAWIENPEQAKRCAVTRMTEETEYANETDK